MRRCSRRGKGAGFVAADTVRKEEELFECGGRLMRG